jgi:predicted small lipoprotein YifL
VKLAYTPAMRVALVIAVLSTATACGQTGSLYLPDESVESPVEIRTTAPPASTVPPPEVEKKEDEDKANEPPGR